MKDRILTAVVVAGVALVAFMSTSWAAGAAAPEDGSVVDLAKPVLDAVMNGQGWMAAAGALMLAVALARRYAPGKAGELVRSDAGGVAASFLMSFAGAAATALAATGGAPSLDVLKTAFGVAAGASGGYVALKKLAVPALRLLQSKVPAWARPLVGMLIWVCERPSAIGRAKAAGDAAVKANPAPGLDGVVGKPERWP
jgi:hypothetical protein